MNCVQVAYGDGQRHHYRERLGVYGILHLVRSVAHLGRGQLDDRRGLVDSQRQIMKLGLVRMVIPTLGRGLHRERKVSPIVEERCT